MSLSKPKETSPVKRYYEWSGSHGQFCYYDKEKEENIYIEEDMFIVPLDELVTVKGFHKSTSTGIYSNEVREYEDILTVKTFKGLEIAKGDWNSIKDKVKNEGGAFAKSLYAVLLSENGIGYELVNFQMYGSAVGPYIDAKINPDTGFPYKFSPSKEEKKNGSVIYFEPKITRLKRRNDVLETCIAFDKELQEYLDRYFGKSAIQKQEEISDKIITEEQKQAIHELNEDVDFSDVDDLPFE